MLWAGLDLRLGRTDGRWYGLLTLLAALQQLFDGAAGARRRGDQAFIGPWALALWGTVAATFAFAARLWRVDGGREDTRLIRAGLWVVAGAMALFGVTGELRRYFELRSLSAETASLASGLAVSAWWLLFAAALVTTGFPAVAAAGPGGRPAWSRGWRCVKVVLFDLSSLDALYRVGSVFLLALVALSLAYLYYRYDRQRADVKPAQVAGFGRLTMPTPRFSPCPELGRLLRLRRVVGGRARRLCLDRLERLGPRYDAVVGCCASPRSPRRVSGTPSSAGVRTAGRCTAFPTG